MDPQPWKLAEEEVSVLGSTEVLTSLLTRRNDVEQTRVWLHHALHHALQVGAGAGEGLRWTEGEAHLEKVALQLLVLVISADGVVIACRCCPRALACKSCCSIGLFQRELVSGLLVLQRLRRRRLLFCISPPLGCS